MRINEKKDIYRGDGKLPAGAGALPFFIDYLILVLGLCGMLGCLITGFSLIVHMQGVLLAAALFSLCDLLFLRIRHGWIFICLQSLGTLIWLWLRTETISKGVLYVEASVIGILSRGFQNIKMPEHLKIVYTELQYAEGADAVYAYIQTINTELFFCLLFLLLTMFVYVYAIRRSVFLTAFLPLPVFVLCFLIIDATMPALWAVGFLLVFWCLLLFGRLTLHGPRLGGSRCLTASDFRIYARQMLYVCVPVILLLSGVYLLFPQEGYVNGSFSKDMKQLYHAVEEKITAWGNRHLMKSSVAFSGGNLFSSSVEGDEIALDTLGRRRYSGRTVLRVKGDQAGIVYLRENTYDTYADNGWKSSCADDDGLGAYLASEGAMQLNALHKVPQTLAIDDAHSLQLFTPYYFYACSVDVEADGDRRYRSDGQSAYTFDYYAAISTDTLSETSLLSTDILQAYMDTDAYRMSLQMPDAAQTAQLRQYVLDRLRDRNQHKSISDTSRDTINGSGEYARWSIGISDILDIVKNSADYSLQPERMPEDADDFVLWFLEDADKGYCVHFATAAVMLLRAYHIPARLATGYLIDVTGGNRWQNVYDYEAHAWAEIYDGRLGWIPVEATPPDGTGRQQMISTQEREPDETKESTEPETESFDTTAPDTLDTIAAGPAVSDTGDTVQDEQPQDSQSLANDTKPPQTSSAAGNEKVKKSKNLLLSVCIIVGVILCFAIFPLRRYVHVYMFQKQISAADSNRALLLYYAQCEKLACAMAVKLPAVLTKYAEKAKFSCHTAETSELTQVSEWYRVNRAALKKQDTVWMRLIHDYITLV